MIDGVAIEEEAARGRRRDVSSRRSSERAQLVRFVVAPDSSLAIDVDERLPGRGLWVAAERAALRRAVERGAFARAAKREVRAPSDLPDRVEEALLRRALDLLSLARRAGAAIAGFEKAREALVAGRGAALITAGDAAEDGREKMRRLARGLPIVEMVDKRRLGVVFGREIVTHVVLIRGGVTERFAREARRLAGLGGARLIEGVSATVEKEDTVER